MKKVLLICSIILVVVGVATLALVRTKAPAPVACPALAKLCPDGSSVGSSGPRCEFEPCPTAENWPSYFSGKPGFSIKHPSSFGVNAAYVYTAMGPGKEIPGVAFTISPNIEVGTNLSRDSYISVETMPRNATCTAEAFLDAAQSTSTVTESGVTYEVASDGGVGAGNIYAETVYLIPGPYCRAVRYMIHSSNIYNYEPGTVREFDRAAVVSLYDQIRQSYHEVP